MTINDSVLIEDTGYFSTLLENGYYSAGSGNARTGYVEGTNAASPTLTITGGTFTGGRYNIKNDDDGHLIITGGTFSNGSISGILNYNIAEITGGTFSSSGNAVILNDKENSRTDEGDLIITGGTFTTKNYGKDVAADDAYIFADTENKSQQTSDVQIKGGTFLGQLEYISETTKTQLDIAGGTFSPALTSDELRDIDTDKYTEIDNGNGTYSILLTNRWTDELRIGSWVVGRTASTPKAGAVYGDVTYTYYNADKKKRRSKPSLPGTYYVKASVAAGRTADGITYQGLESGLVKFKIEYATALNLKAVSAGKTSDRLTWSKVSGADNYTIYYARCGKTLKKIKTTKSTSYTRKGLTTGKDYKYKVVANTKVNGKTVVMAKSLTVHTLAGKYNSKYTVARKVTAKKTSLLLSTGKTTQLLASTAKAKAGRSLLPTTHAAKYRYVSTNKNVAKVSRTGKVTAVGNGTCKIRILAQNGVYTNVNVTVK